MTFVRTSTADYFEDSKAKSLIKATNVIEETDYADGVLGSSSNPMEVYVVPAIRNYTSVRFRMG